MHAMQSLAGRLQHWLKTTGGIIFFFAPTKLSISIPAGNREKPVKIGGKDIVLLAFDRTLRAGSHTVYVQAVHACCGYSRHVVGTAAHSFAWVALPT